MIKQDMPLDCNSPEAKHSFKRIIEILYEAKTVFTRSAITPPEMNRFGQNLEHREHIVGGWPWQILGAICTVASLTGRRNFVCFFAR